jgi:predicted phage-related endonuclease
MTAIAARSHGFPGRRSFIGGSDARTIMGGDEAALVRLWREKRGEAEPEDLSGNLVVQLGNATEGLNRLWYERNTGHGPAAAQHVGNLITKFGPVSDYRGREMG